MRSGTSKRPFFEGPSWSFEKICEAMELCEEINDRELGLPLRRNQIEIVNAEQMADAYASFGLPVMYRHWSIGKSFLKTWDKYCRGKMNLAYEMILNSDPCISYLMETNTMAMQLAVIAHACIGHNAFFTNNWLFKTRTQPDFIIDYLLYARNYIEWAEEKYGQRAVERTIDWAHVLRYVSVDKFQRRRGRDEGVDVDSKQKPETSDEMEAMLRRIKRAGESRGVNPEKSNEEEEEETGYSPPGVREIRESSWILDSPEENILYYIEKNSPSLEPWQREIVRIVRLVWAYMYPQVLTKVANEGTATWVERYITNRLREEDLIDNGTWLEILHSITDVIFQPELTTHGPRWGAHINPYALGYAILADVERMCKTPDEEDARWFPDLVGSDWRKVLLHLISDFDDQSLVYEYLGPKVMRKFRMAILCDDPNSEEIVVREIADDQGYDKIRKTLAARYDYEFSVPDLSVIGAKMKGDRSLYLRYTVRGGRKMTKSSLEGALHALWRLWGYPVFIEAVDAETGKTVERFGCGT